MAERIAELDGVLPAASTDPDVVAGRAAVLVADLTEPAHSNALEKLDEGHKAYTIATGWMRSTLESRSASTDLEAPPPAITR